MGEKMQKSAEVPPLQSLTLDTYDVGYFEITNCFMKECIIMFCVVLQHQLTFMTTCLKANVSTKKLNLYVNSFSS